jgi:hypothetical protein
MRPGQAKIEQLHPVLGEEDVRRFEVPVDDAAGMERLERRQDPEGGVQPFAQRERFPADSRGQRFAGEQLHDDIKLAALLAQLVHLADVGMGDGGGGAGLAQQALAKGGLLKPHALDGDGAIEPLVSGLVHHAHAALAELLPQAIVAQHLGVGRRRQRRLKG